jgi:hypothetical protein
LNEDLQKAEAEQGFLQERISDWIETKEPEVQDLLTESITLRR